MAAVKKKAENTVQDSSDSQNGAETGLVKENTAETENKAKNGKYATEKETYIYIGPTVRAGALKANTMLTGTKEEVKGFLENILEEIPQVEKLLIPLNKLADSKNRVNSKGTLLNKYYNEIISLDTAKKEE